MDDYKQKVLILRAAGFEIYQRGNYDLKPHQVEMVLKLLDHDKAFDKLLTYSKHLMSYRFEA